MAKQKGIIKPEGTLGDITFLKTKDGYLAREKGGVSADRIATDPAFQRTRENGAEFGRAGRACKLLRLAFRSLLQNASDSRMVGRLTAEMIRVIQADSTNPRGLRNVLDGETELLLGFEFNADARLSCTVYATYTATINRTTGAATVALPPFVPVTAIAAPPGTTHFRINTAAASIDFEGEVFDADEALSAELPWNSTATAAISLVSNLPAASTHPLFLVMGVDFMQEVNGVKYPLKSGSYNPLSIVQVSGL